MVGTEGFAGLGIDRLSSGDGSERAFGQNYKRFVSLASRYKLSVNNIDARSSSPGAVLTWFDLALDCPLQCRQKVHLEIVHLLQEIRVHCSSPS